MSSHDVLAVRLGSLKKKFENFLIRYDLNKAKVLSHLIESYMEGIKETGKPGYDLIEAERTAKKIQLLSKEDRRAIDRLIDSLSQ